MGGTKQIREASKNMPRGRNKKGGRGQSILINTGGYLSIEKIKSYRVQNGRLGSNLTGYTVMQNLWLKVQRTIKGGFWASCRLEIWLKLGDDLVNLRFKSCRNGEFGKAGDGDFAI